jgi:hypothetical protein
MDPQLEREARRLLDRYLREVVERFGLCPWAEPARARGEVRIAVVDAADAGAALDAFAADEGAVLGLVVLPRFAADAAALRRLRDQLLDGPRGAALALADFHPDAAPDTSDAERLVPWLRRSPDPMLQAVRHQTLASLRRAAETLPASAQAAALAGHAAAPPPSAREQVAAANLATVRAHGDAIAAALDDIARDRAASYAALNTSR